MRRRLYDWDGWFKRKRFTIFRGAGRDYECFQTSMAQQVRNAAYQRGLKVRIVEGDNSLTILVEGPPGTAPLRGNPRRRALSSAP